ncbi:hypothetical protein CPT_Slocum_037 [Serratia phage Slocum]|nr:hypothetical protein CPT_Slocum_037 [Serratia phage Slocum]
MKTTHEEVRKFLEGGLKKTECLDANEKYFVMKYHKQNGSVLLVKYTRNKGLNTPELLESFSSDNHGVNNV